MTQIVLKVPLNPNQSTDQPTPTCTVLEYSGIRGVSWLHATEIDIHIYMTSQSINWNYTSVTANINRQICAV